jgi:hypothetical protein
MSSSTNEDHEDQAQKDEEGVVGIHIFFILVSYE